MGEFGTTLRRAALGMALMAGLAACSPTVRNHGYIPPESDLSQVAVGVDTRETVIEKIGRPISEGMSGTGDYFYIASKFRHYGPLAPKEFERQVLVISFDGQDRVANLERFGLEQGRVIVLSRRVTDDNVRDTTLIRQLLRNIGQFNAGDLLGSE